MLNEVFSSGTELAERKHPAWTSLVFALSACDTAGIDPAQLGLLKVYVGITPVSTGGDALTGKPYGTALPGMGRSTRPAHAHLTATHFESILCFTQQTGKLVL